MGQLISIFLLIGSFIYIQDTSLARLSEISKLKNNLTLPLVNYSDSIIAIPLLLAKEISMMIS